MQFAGAAMQTVQAVGGTVASFQSQQQNIEEMKAQGQQLIAANAYDSARLKREQDLLLAKASAITAATGADTSTGSPLLLELDNVRQAALERLNLNRTFQMELAKNQRDIKQAGKNTAWTVLSMGGNSGSVGAAWANAAKNYRESRSGIRVPRTASSKGYGSSEEYYPSSY